MFDCVLVSQTLHHHAHPSSNRHPDPSRRHYLISFHIGAHHQIVSGCHPDGDIECYVMNVASFKIEFVLFMVVGQGVTWPAQNHTGQPCCDCQTIVAWVAYLIFAIATARHGNTYGPVMSHLHPLLRWQIELYITTVDTDGTKMTHRRFSSLPLKEPR